MSTYLVPLRGAVAVFPVLALLLVVPVAAVAYRRRGRAGGWAGAMTWLFVFTLLAAFLQTLLPLPADPDTCARTTYASRPALVPFAFVGDIAARPGFLNAALLTSGLNLLLLLPLGFFARYLLGRGPVVTAALGLGTSLFFELTQLTGVWGLYPCPYRLFNVDDLILNTAGAVIGWVVAGLLAGVLPRIDPSAERTRYGLRVTVGRRLVALALDLGGIAVVVGLVTGLATLLGLPAADRPLVSAAVEVVVGVVWFVAVRRRVGGSPGERAVLLRVVAGDDVPTTGRLLVREGVRLAPWWLAGVGALVTAAVDDTRAPGAVVVLAILVLLVAAAVVVFVWSPLAVLTRADRLAPYERWSGTRIVAVPSGPRADHQPRSRHSGSWGRSAPSVVSSPWPG